MHPPKFTILDKDEELCESIIGAFDDGNIFLIFEDSRYWNDSHKIYISLD